MNDLGIITEAIIAALLVIGAFFTLVGSIGLIKLDNCMSRLHGPTKASTLGVGSLLIASVVYSFQTSDGSVHEILVMVFLFATAPISANFIAKVNMHRLRGKKALPPPPGDPVWSTYSEK
ncbi:multisubunit potassium/proton antiporter, PhaG subunit [Sulfitobacter marinus]|uniref:Multisubunit potassium/proton antiporter, PhaG subunit n=1 Tax=Sulfitobacter marinus TaxID=394264 RepID=A0A1I6QD93_9RHOB|nr:Na+/H+ antiporter subunit G [Sulfitobacter marinus]SFS50268.1 multisubunit potassium/proton antiporter, PhaG subunit [Sulfitobacter marinus]